MGRTSIAAGARIAGWVVGASAALAVWAPLAGAATVAHDPPNPAAPSGTAMYSAGTAELNQLAVKLSPDGASLLFEEAAPAFDPFAVNDVTVNVPLS